MRTAVVLAATAAGVILTAGTAAADTSTPTPSSAGAWTVTDTRTDSSNTLPTASTPAPVADQAGEQQMRRAPVQLPSRTPSQRRPVSRTGIRLAVGCQGVRDGAWIVRPGDTLWRISICTHRDLTDLVQVNDLPFGGRLVFPGDPIIIPSAR